ncbi:MAG: EF-hand domain-containing protein [Verrucomicrobia bacterium]|nr:MAG: EF-hand domain-containing protein [Verrucomicrobiota bacterium]
MKTKLIISTLGALALATTLASAEDKPAGPGGRPSHHQPGEIFKKLDTNNDGSVSEAEFKAGPRAQKDPAKAAEIFKKLDKDNSGGVTAEELKAARPHGGPGKGRGDCKKRGGGTAPAAA